MLLAANRTSLISPLRSIKLSHLTKSDSLGEYMPTIVNVRDAKTNFSRLLERAHDGEEIVLAKAGKPYAKLVPLEERKERKPGLAKGAVTDAFFGPLPAEELDAWGQ